MLLSRRHGPLALLLLSACFGDESSGPRPIPSALQIAAGGVQTGVVAQPLDTALTVRVRDQNGEPMAGVLVQFVLADTAGTLSHLTRTTGPDGEAATLWTLPQKAGAYATVARVAELDSVSFSAQAAPGAAAQPLVVAGDSQGATVGTSLDSTLVVRVQDQYGNPIAGVTVTFAVASGGGGLAPTAASTDSVGEVRTNWTLGNLPGPQEATAATTGGSSVSLTAHALLPPQRPGTIGSGFVHGCRLQSNGVTECWGENSYGSVGDGTTQARPTPVPTLGGISFAAVVVSGDDSCALTAAGIAYCWSAYTSGPTPVQGQASPFVDLTLGFSHRCGLTMDGQAWCSGGNNLGQLGDGSTQDQLGSWTQAGSALRFRQISAGGNHTCAITRDGFLYCWGFNNFGQLGVGAGATFLSSPVRVAPATRFSAVAVSGRGGCALTATGATWCWGAPITPFNGTPILVGGSEPFTRIWAGYDHFCGLTAAGAACFGNNTGGQLGIGVLDSVPHSTSVPVIGGHAFTELALGEASSCGRTSAGEVLCWGANHRYSLGIGVTHFSSKPVAVTGGLSFGSISVGDGFACGLTSIGEAWCWGDGSFGALGNGDSAFRATPTPTAGGLMFTSLGASAHRACGLTAQGAAWCWGANGVHGALGDGTTVDRAVPTAVTGGHQFVSLSVTGLTHSCGLKSDQTLWCWGGNSAGQLGDSSQTDRLVPTQVQSGVTFASVRAGTSHTCALDTAGLAYCWGSGDQAGQGSNVQRLVPSPIAGNLVLAVLGEGGGSYSCGLELSGTVWCWGNGGSWFGNGSGAGVVAYSPVVAAGGATFNHLATTYIGACGIGGATLCWGVNPLGDGTMMGSTSPVPVAGGHTFIQVSTGLESSCGLTPTGDAWCWGHNKTGELGNGVAAYLPYPVLQP